MSALLNVVQERAERPDADVIGQVLTVSSGMNAIGAETLREPFDAFIRRKSQEVHEHGFAPVWLPDFLFPFQGALAEWSIRKGRSGIFADCGLGKTPIQLVVAENIVRHTNRPVLILTPLAVAQQTVREGAKFGVEVHRTRGQIGAPGVYVTNYEQLHHFDPSTFTDGGVICDESGILKNFAGVLRGQITDFMSKIRYRLLCTATAAPNDYFELGTSAEALGELGFIDMLGRFFKNARNNVSTGRGWEKGAQWRFRGHAEKPFWRWVCSWARALRKPSDMGFGDGAFKLPPLIEREHVVRGKPLAGMLFSMPAVGLQEERAERRNTQRERCEMAAQLVADGKPAVAWCHLNPEGDLLEKLIPGSVQISGHDKGGDDEREEKFEAFLTGQARVLVTKPKIGAWGLNWQHCAHMTTFGGHSFEQYYQSVRRCWRFGQRREVIVDHVLSDGEERVVANLRRKAEQADKLFAELTAHIQDELRVERGRRFEREETMPSWL